MASQSSPKKARKHRVTASTGLGQEREPKERIDAARRLLDDRGKVLGGQRRDFGGAHLWVHDKFGGAVEASEGFNDYMGLFLCVCVKKKKEKECNLAPKIRQMESGRTRIICGR